MKTIIFVDPSFKNEFGHQYVQFFSLNAYFEAIKPKFKYYFVGNKDLSQNIIKLFNGKLFALLNAMPFELNQEQQRINDIDILIKFFKLNRTDFIFYVSGYLFDISAITTYLNKFSEAPTFGLHIHQKFKPETDSEMIYMKINIKLTNLLHKRILSVASPKLKLFTTESKKLNTYINKFAYAQTLPIIVNRTSNKNPKYYSFIGDSRKEKGLFFLLKFLQKYADLLCFVTFFISTVNIRYFNKVELEEINFLIATLKKKVNVKITHANTTFDIKTALTNTKVMLLPYDKRNYNMRVSAIALECVVNGIPIITSEKTSIDEMLLKGKVSGISFKLEAMFSKSAKALYNAIINMENQFDERQIEAEKLKIDANKSLLYTPNQYFELINKQWNLKN